MHEGSCHFHPRNLWYKRHAYDFQSRSQDNNRADDLLVRWVVSILFSSHLVGNRNINHLNAHATVLGSPVVLSLLHEIPHVCANAETIRDIFVRNHLQHFITDALLTHDETQIVLSLSKVTRNEWESCLLLISAHTGECQCIRSGTQRLENI